MKTRLTATPRSGFFVLLFALTLALAALLGACGGGGNADTERASSDQAREASMNHRARGPSRGRPGSRRSGFVDWRCLNEDSSSSWRGRHRLGNRLAYRVSTILRKVTEEDFLDESERGSVAIELTRRPGDPSAAINEFGSSRVGEEQAGEVVVTPPGFTPILSDTLPTTSTQNILFSINDPQTRFLCAFRDVVGETVRDGRNVSLGEFGALGLPAVQASRRSETKGDKILVFEPYLGLIRELAEPGKPELIIAWDPVREAPAMNKAELIDAIASKSGLSKADSKKALDGFINATTRALKKGDRVSLVGFGSFSISKRAARTGRNPQTGKEIKIAAKNVVKFKAGADLSSKVN